MQGERLMGSFLGDLWKLLSDYKLRGHWADGKEAFAIPLSWLFIVILALCF